MKKKKTANYGNVEKLIAKKYEFLHGRKLRSKSDMVFCKGCGYDNGVQCMYDILVAHGEKPTTKYPCGKAKVQYDEMMRKKR